MVNTITKLFPSIKNTDFYPINTWTPDTKEGAPTFTNRAPQSVIDSSSKRGYLNDTRGCVRFKCFLLIFGTPIVHSIASVLNVAYRILRLVSGYHFWCTREGETKYDLKTRALEACGDLIRVGAAPLIPVALIFSAIYGLVRPYDGRKMYATFERMQYNSFILAPCFQPNATSHLLGSDINEQDGI